MSALAGKAKSGKQRYTYIDYCSWGESIKRCELIDGVVHMMAAPTVLHQRVAGNIYYEMRTFFKGRTCEPFIAPFDVRLNPKGLDDTVVQPDIVVICDPRKVEDGKACKGAPDLVVEVISPKSSKRDRLIKFKKYEQAGVREYWIVDPENQTIETFIHEENKLIPHGFSDNADEKVTSRIFKELDIKMSDIFDIPAAPETAPPPEEILENKK